MQVHSLKQRLTSAFWSVVTMTFMSGLFFSGMEQPGTDVPISWAFGWAIGAAISTVSTAVCFYFAPRLSVGGHKEYWLHALTGLLVGAAALFVYALLTEGIAWVFDASYWMLKLGIAFLGSFAACDYHILLTKNDKTSGGDDHSDRNARG